MILDGLLVRCKGWIESDAKEKSRNEGGIDLC